MIEYIYIYIAMIVLNKKKKEKKTQIYHPKWKISCSDSHHHRTAIQQRASRAHDIGLLIRTSIMQQEVETKTFIFSGLIF